MRTSRIILAGLFVFLAVNHEAHASWLMIGGYEFQALSSLQNAARTSNGMVLEYASSGSGATGYLAAPIKLPKGSVISGIWCQIYDTSANRNVVVSVDELQTLDNQSSSSGQTRNILYMYSTGAPGHTKIATTSMVGEGSIKDWAGAPATYYSYAVTVTLGEAYKNAVKACAISYY